MRLTSMTAITLAVAACAAPKDRAGRDSADTLPSSTPPAVVGETARAAEPMPTAAPRESAAPMPAARESGGTAKMPNATTAKPAPPPAGKKPPSRVVPDPVLPPRDSVARP